MLIAIVIFFIGLIPISGFSRRRTEQILINQGGYYPNAALAYLAGTIEALQFDAGYSE